MKGLSLAGWKKIAADKKTTTLQHDKGHIMTLAHASLPKIQQEALKRIKFADGGDVSSDSQDSGEKPAAPVTVNISTPAMGAPVQSAQPVPVEAPKAPPVQSALLPNGSMNAPATAQMAQQGADLQSKVEAEKGRATALQQQQYLNQTSQLNQMDVDHINDLKQKANDFSEYTKNNPLKENAYLENMGAGKKMRTGLGLILSGAGGGITGQGNMAMDFLNKQIDRNIEAQKSRYGQQASVWGAYKDLYNNENVATNMARVHALDMLAHQGDLTAAQLATPTAQAANLLLKSKLSQEKNKAILDSAGNLSSTPNMPKGGVAPMAEDGAPIPQGASNSHKAAMDAGLIAGKGGGGMPQANASLPPDEKPKEDYFESHILAPDAVQHFKNLAYTPKAKDDLAAIQSQYNQATQAEKSLGDIHSKFADLTKETNGVSGRVHRGLNPHAIGAIGAGLGAAAAGIPSLGFGVPIGAAGGAAAGEAVGHGIQGLTNTAANRSYDSDKTALIGYLSSALKGTNIGAGQIQEIVDNNSPESGDTPQLLAKKEKNIKEFIINHTDTSLLKTWGLSKR